jgi:hypothetical protein
MLRYLRIAVTALCLTVCVLLVALWVRSHQTYDIWSKVLTKNQSLAISSVMGKLSVNWSYDASAAWKWPDHAAWQWKTESAPDWQERINRHRLTLGITAAKSWQPPIYFRQTQNIRAYVLVRYWVLVLITAILAAALGIRRPYNFSLRTLLIATTLVAVGLWLVVALS